MSTNAQLKTIEDYVQLQRRNALCHAIRAAVDLGILDSLSKGQKTSEQLAELLSLNPQATDRLMHVLAGTELVDKYGEDYALSNIARLIPRPFLDFGDHYWQYLASHVRSGTSLVKDDSIPHTEADFWATQAHKEWMLTPVALDVARVLSMGESRTGLSILHLGCGSAVFGVTLAHRDPLSKLTLVDTATNLKRANQTIESVELGREVTQIAGVWDDLSTCEGLEQGSYDLVIIANRIHWRSPEQIEQLAKDLATYVRADGELAIVDIFPGKEEGVLARAEHDLELGLRTDAGQLHDPIHLRKSLERSGYGEIQFAHLTAEPGYWGITLSTRI
jgi:SAM-dependent methyltransferase